MNVILIGMPGCGKSTVGVVLAKRLGFRFADTDLIIQEKSGRLLQEIIDDCGSQALLELEQEVLTDWGGDNTVVATGGSAVYSDKGMAHLRENGTAVYIKLSLEQVKGRLDNLEKRGVAGAEDHSLAELYNERTPLYERYADTVVEADSMTIEQTIEAVYNSVKSLIQVKNGDA